MDLGPIGFAGGREGHAAVGALEQLDPQECLEVVHLPADCAGRQMQLFGGLGHAETAPDGLENGQRRHRRQNAARPLNHFPIPPGKPLDGRVDND
ncbi:hypothetical protein D9M68_982060 [compost metagenome]